MVNKSTPIQKTARLLDLVPYISTHQGVSLQDLAEQFSITQQELLSDLNTLWMCGLPGYTPLELIDLEFESGFVSIRNAQTLNIPRSLSQQEIISLKLGLDIVKDQLPPERDDLLQELDSLQRSFAPFIQATAIAEAPVTSEKEKVIRKAITERTNICFTYTSISDDALTHRTVSPIDIYPEGPHQYLRAFCHLAHSGRTFRVDRMSDIEILAIQADSVVRPAPALHTVQDGSKVDVLIHRDSRSHREALGRAIIKESSSADDSSENTQVSVRALSTSWLLRTVIAGAGALEVIGDMAMREAVSGSAAKALSLYSSNSSHVR